MKRKYVLILTFGICIISILLIYLNLHVKGYEVNNVGNSVKVTGIELENDESRFNAIFKLGNDQTLQAAFIDIEVAGKVIKDGEEFKLENGNVSIKTYGCKEIGHDFELLDKRGYNSNRQYEQSNKDDVIKETMPVGLVKQILTNKNIDVINIISDDKKIKYRNELLRENNNDKMVTLEYKSLGTFNKWFSIKVIPTGENELSIEVF